MSDLDALLAAIIAHPDEDTPRLAYADALDERGESGDANHAAFIRTTIEYLRLTRLHEQGKATRTDSNKLREVAAAWRACRWLAGLPNGVGWNYGDLKQRGFVEEVVCVAGRDTSDRWPEVGDEVCRLCPLLRQVILAAIPEIIDRGTFFRFRGDPQQASIPGDVIYSVYPPDTLAHVCLRYRWPGITFNLPSGRTPVSFGDITTLTLTSSARPVVT